MVGRTTFLCVGRKLPREKEKFKERARGKERKRKTFWSSFHGWEGGMRSGAGLWVGEIHTPPCKVLTVVLST